MKTRLRVFMLTLSVAGPLLAQNNNQLKPTWWAKYQYLSGHAAAANAGATSSCIDLGNQQGDYEGLTSLGGVSHPVWTDGRDNLEPSTCCPTNLLVEEVFSATVNTSKGK
jgi:hypothetical protein